MHNALPDGVLGPIKNKPVRLSDGTIIASSSVESPSGWRVHFERSVDGGKSWTIVYPPSNAGAEIDAIQPSILIHSDGRLQAVGRSRSQRSFRNVVERWRQDVVDAEAHRSSESEFRYRCRHAEGRTSARRVQPHDRGTITAERRGIERRHHVAGGTRARGHAGRVLVPRGHSDVGRTRARHVHVEASGDQARRDRPEANVARRQCPTDAGPGSSSLRQQIAGASVDEPRHQRRAALSAHLRQARARVRATGRTFPRPHLHDPHTDHHGEQREESRRLGVTAGTFDSLKPKKAATAIAPN